MQFFITFFSAVSIWCVLIFLSCAMAPFLIKHSGTRPLMPLLGAIGLALAANLRSFFDWPVWYFQAFILTISVLGFLHLFSRRDQLKLSFDWHYLWIALLLLPLAVKLGVTSFDVNDEIYSWNYWANQIFLGEPIDFYFTQAPYPTFFSGFIAGIYLLLGGIEYQSTAKLALWVLPYCCLLLLYEFSQAGKEWFFWLTAVLILYGIGLEKVFATGLADPFMTAMLFAGVYCLFQSAEIEPDKPLVLLLVSALFVAVSAVSKQAALIWGIIFYPLAAVFYVRRYSLPFSFAGVMALPVIVSLIWVLTVGSGFQNNQGVLQASMSGRGYAEQLIFALKNLLIDSPMTALIFVLFLWMALTRCPIDQKILGFGCLVSALLWLLFGSYDIRLGMHFLMILWLLTSLSVYKWLPQHIFSRRIKQVLNALIVVLLGSYATNKYVSLASDYETEMGSLKFNQGWEKQVVKLFGSRALPLFEEIRESKLKIWAASNYIYGVTYGQIETVRPEIDGFSPESVFGNTDSELISYVLLSRDSLGFSRANVVMRNYIEATQSCFDKIPLPDNYVGLEVYKLVTPYCRS